MPSVFETYVQTRSDSVLIVLRQIDTASLKHPKERAQFALLQAIDLDKNYIDTTDLQSILGTDSPFLVDSDLFVVCPGCKIGNSISLMMILIGGLINSYFGGITLRSGRRGFAIYREGKMIEPYSVIGR